MNRTLILQGSAGEALGEKWNVNAPTIGEAFAIVHANKPKEFIDYFGKNDAQDEFVVKLAGEALEENELLMYNLKGEDIIVTPVPRGSKMNPLSKIILAIVIILIAIYAPQYLGMAMETTAAGAPTLAAAGIGGYFQMAGIMMGLSLAMQGITELMMKDPSVDKDEQGAMFGGPQNTIKQGQPIPLAYGKIMVGGTPINMGFGNYKLKPTNGYHFDSDNPDAWDGVLYEAGAVNAASTSSTNTNTGQGGSSGDVTTDDTFDQDSDTTNEKYGRR